MKQYLLSIIIPTRNRQKYCISAINQIISLGFEDVQVVVQDNSDNDELNTVIKSLPNTSNIKYHYTNNVISFVDNFSEAINLSEGEYVCMIGDDDGVLPNILSVTNYAKNNEIDCVIPGHNSVYIWPSLEPIVKGADNGYLCLSYINNSLKEINSESAVFQLMKTGGQNYLNLDLPRVYHGIVKRERLDDVKRTVGTYFAGLTPDIFMAVALSQVCKKVVSLGYPVTVSGICPGSGSSNSATGKHTGELRDAPHFVGHDKYNWDVKAPEIYSVESIWAETVLHALHLFNREDLYNSFNVAFLDSICLSKYPQFSKTIIEHARNNGVCISIALLKYYFINVLKISNKVIRKLFRSRQDVIKLYNIPNISAAVKETNDFMSRVF